MFCLKMSLLMAGNQYNLAYSDKRRCKNPAAVSHQGDKFSAMSATSVCIPLAVRDCTRSFQQVLCTTSAMIFLNKFEEDSLEPHLKLYCAHRLRQIKFASNQCPVYQYIPSQIYFQVMVLDVACLERSQILI